MNWFKPKMSASSISDLLIAYTISGDLKDEPDTMALKAALGPRFYGDTGDEQILRINQSMVRATAAHRLVHSMLRPKRQAEAVWSAYLAATEGWAGGGLFAKLLDDWLVAFEATLMESDIGEHGVPALAGGQRHTEEDIRRMISCMGRHYTEFAPDHSGKSAEALAQEGEKIFLDSLSYIHTMLEKIVTERKIV
jgi:hypothetical protein